MLIFRNHPSSLIPGSLFFTQFSIIFYTGGVDFTLTLPIQIGYIRSKGIIGLGESGH